MQSVHAPLSETPARSWPKRYGATVGIALAATIALVWIGVWHLNLKRELAMAVSMGVMLVMAVLLAVREFSGRPRAGATVAHGVPQQTEPARLVPPDTGRWSLDVLDTMSPPHFARMCETWFSWAGFDTRTEPHRGDDGVDIWLHAQRVAGPVAIVRCRHMRNQPVGLRDMQEFFGVVSAHKTAHGTYTTTSTYTPEALQFAQERGIDAVDGRGLLRRIQTRTRRSQQALLAVAFQVQSA